MLTSDERLRLQSEWDEDRREAFARKIERLAGMLKAPKAPQPRAGNRPAAPEQPDPNAAST
jgi:hypothetical protein